jgi:integrase/recombinase XerD
MVSGWSSSASLYSLRGERKYINRSERDRLLAAMTALPARKSLFALVLTWTGARPSEVLTLAPIAFQIEASVVAIRTLKRRRFVMREIPIPPELMAALVSEFDLVTMQRDPERAYGRLWKFSRTTAWRIIKQVMKQSGVGGRQACPRGLRHGFGIGTLQAGVPINLTRTWLGHSSLATTEIYTAACGPEEVFFIERFWHTTPRTV